MLLAAFRYLSDRAARAVRHVDFIVETSVLTNSSIIGATKPPFTEQYIGSRFLPLSKSEASRSFNGRHFLDALHTKWVWLIPRSSRVQASALAFGCTAGRGILGR